MTITPQNQSARVGDGLAFAGRPGKAVDSAYTLGQRTRVVFWGTYDTGKPRARILLRGLQEAGVEVIECHVSVWSGVEDKSQLSGWWSRLRYILMRLISYPILIARYLRLPAHDADIIGYMGQLDVLVMWPFARLRGGPIVWDALMSLYIAIVVDRQQLSPRSPLARLLYAWEWVGTRAADLIILNHQVVVDYWAELFGLPAEKFKTAYIGAEIDAFPARKPGPPKLPAERPLILFYGTLIPSHGFETLLRPRACLTISRSTGSSSARGRVRRWSSTCSKSIHCRTCGGSRGSSMTSSPAGSTVPQQRSGCSAPANGRATPFPTRYSRSLPAAHR